MKKKLRRSEKKLATYSNAYHWNSKHSIHSVTTATTPAYMKSTYIKHMYNNLLKLLVFVVLFCFCFVLLFWYCVWCFFLLMFLLFLLFFLLKTMLNSTCVWCIYATGWLLVLADVCWQYVLVCAHRFPCRIFCPLLMSVCMHAATLLWLLYYFVLIRMQSTKFFEF